jgi:elongation factor 2 kinase
MTVFQVDIFQMYILEFKNRPDSPLYHCEHFIEGHYIKYNSNSGFVEENIRYTPQVSDKLFTNVSLGIEV